jgi:hypothetical protein
VLIFQVKSKLKKSVSFKMEPEVETFQSEKSGKTIKKTVKKIVRVGRVRQSLTRTIIMLY